MYAVFDYLTIPSPVSWQGVKNQTPYIDRFHFQSFSAEHRISRVRLGCRRGSLHGYLTPEIYLLVLVSLNVGS